MRYLVVIAPRSQIGRALVLIECVTLLMCAREGDHRPDPAFGVAPAFERRPSLAAAIWRETLVDAAIFREATTNNSARSASGRMGHLFCELVYKAKLAGLSSMEERYAPMTLPQMGGSAWPIACHGKPDDRLPARPRSLRFP
jgi:hypothetical protein